RAHARAERGRDRLAGLGAADVRDPAERVTAFTAEVVVELDSEADEVLDPGGRLLGERAHRALAAEPAPGAERVFRVQHRFVVLGQRGGDTALRLPGVRRRGGT